MVSGERSDLPQPAALPATSRVLEITAYGDSVRNFPYTSHDVPFLLTTAKSRSPTVAETGPAAALYPGPGLNSVFSLPRRSPLPLTNLAMVDVDVRSLELWSQERRKFPLVATTPRVN